MRPVLFIQTVNTPGKGIDRETYSMTSNYRTSIENDVGKYRSYRNSQNYLLVPESQRPLSGGSDIHVENGVMSKLANHCWQ